MATLHRNDLTATNLPRPRAAYAAPTVTLLFVQETALRPDSWLSRFVEFQAVS
jgi:hypothetical protein